MKLALAIVLLLLASSALAEELSAMRWHRAMLIEPARVHVVEISAEELAELRRKRPGARSDIRNMRAAESLHGFSVVGRVKADGAIVCNIYVVDKSDAALIEHERKHCWGWKHD